MAEINQDKLVSHNKFGLEIDGQDLYVLSISGFGSSSPFFERILYSV